MEPCVWFASQQREKILFKNFPPGPVVAWFKYNAVEAMRCPQLSHSQRSQICVKPLVIRAKKHVCKIFAVFFYQIFTVYASAEFRVVFFQDVFDLFYTSYRAVFNATQNRAFAMRLFFIVIQFQINIFLLLVHWLLCLCRIEYITNTIYRLFE